MIAEHVQSSCCYTFGKNQTTVAAGLACVNQKALFAQTKVFLCTFVENFTVSTSPPLYVGLRVSAGKQSA